RGTKEMDLLLGNFANVHVMSFGAEQLAEYEEVLSINDPDLYNMYLGKRAPDDDQKSDILGMFLEFILKPA
ncbi:MAG: succinate dehydrogenase assembly factor 2, partial [Bdellovibrionales bacterium]